MNKRTMDFIDHTCKECGRQLKNRRAVGNHINRAHNIALQEYVLKYEFKGSPPLCICGCGQEVSWHKAFYTYNDYVNGHNKSGYTRKNWQPTQAQTDKRKEAIRSAYEKKDKEIKEKISNSLKKTFANPLIKEKLSIAQREGWNKPGVKEKASLRKKQDWAERHDELYQKIFTDEFRKKISQANTKRGLATFSKKEEMFKKHIENIWQEKTFNADCWLTHGNVSKCYDIFISSKRLLIEFDDIHLHGLDREKDFTVQQLNNMTDAFIKNRLASEAGFELIRIRGDAKFEEIKSLFDLYELAYHHQLYDGKIIKDGMFKFKNELHAIISRETLIRTNETEIFNDAPGRDFTRENILPAVRAFFREYVAARGWFFPEQKLTLSQTLKQLNNYSDIDSDSISSLTNISVGYLKSNFKSYWSVDKGPINAFHDDRKLDYVLKYRLGLNNSKLYNYTLSDGHNVSCKETFDINIKNIRFGFIVQRSAVSFFKPTAARQIYRYILNDVTNPKVWDPSAGFGGRMLGFASAYPEGTYYGNEPALMTYNDNVALGNKIQQLNPKFSFQLFQQGSEISLQLCDIDLVFTSPPYFDREKYFDDPTQCWKMFSTRDTWRDGFLLPTFNNAYKMLKANGFLVINIDEINRMSVEDAATKAGFVLKKELKLQIGRDHFSRKAKHFMSKLEPILIFQKHSPHFC